MKKNSNKFPKFSKFLGIIFIATTILSACDSSNPTPNSTVNTDPTCAKPTLDAKLARTQVLGTWKWIQTETTSRGGSSISNPTSEGKSQGLTFKENSVDELVKGSVISSYGYNIEATPLTGELTMTYTNAAGDVIRTYNLAFCSGSLKITPTNVSINVTHLYNK